MNSRLSPRAARVVGVAALMSLAALAGCSSSSGGPPDSTARASAGDSASSVGGSASSQAASAVGARFAAYAGPDSRAVSYDARQVPAGATAAVTISASGASTQVRLQVTGLQPGRAYGAHLHKKACGAAPADAGGHYQNAADPVQPSTNPKFANPGNEVWLDFMTDAHGAASSQATVPFGFRTGAQGPQSMVIHAMTTKTAPGKAGTAGPRLACLNLGS